MQIDGTNDFIFNYQLLNGLSSYLHRSHAKTSFFFLYKDAMQINISKVNFVSTNQFYII
jgi:hypothetical protein